MSPAAAIQFAATAYMTGVIWMVQGVHYPMLGRVGSSFDDCQTFHLSRMTYIVAGPMVVEAITAVLLVMRAPAEPMWWVGLALLVGIWASTFFVQVPAHERLACSFDALTHRRLVRTNWIRTALWTARLAIVSWLLANEHL